MPTTISASERQSGASAPHPRLSAILVVAGSLLLAVSPSARLSLLSMVLLVAGLATRPALGLPLLAFALPFYLHSKRFGPMAFSMPEVILLCTAAGATVHATYRWLRGSRTPLAALATPLDGPIALFLAASILSLLASEVLRVSVRDLRTLVLEPIAAYYLALWFTRTTADERRLLMGLLLGGAAAALVGLYQFVFTDHVIVVEGSRRVLGPYLSPNNLGLYLGRVVPIALAVALFLPRARVPGLLLAAVLLAALLLTFSLGAWLASFLAISAVVLLWFRSLGVGWGRRASLASIAAVLGLALAALPLLNIERIASHFSLAGGTSFIRLQLWESSLRMIQDHPLLGVGMDNFLYHYRSSYLLPEAAAEPNLSHPHNLVLNLWLQVGILGVAAAAWLAIALAREWRRAWAASAAPWEKAVLAGIAGVLVDLLAHGMVDNSYFLVDLAFQFWISAALVTIIRTRVAPTTATPNRVHYAGPHEWPAGWKRSDRRSLGFGSADDGRRFVHYTSSILRSAEPACAGNGGPTCALS